MNIVEKNIGSVRKLCKKHKVEKLYAFGSVLTNRFNKKSDIDLLVKFGKVRLYDYADNYFDFKFASEDSFHRNIDLLEDQAIKNPYLRQSIDESKKLIYG